MLRPIGSFLVLLAAGCVAPKDGHTVDSSPPEGLELSLATVETVVRARWETATPTRADVVASFEGSEIVVSESEPTTSHEVLLTGLPSLTDVAVTIPADDTDEVLAGDIRTGALPAWVPDFDFSLEEVGLSEGGIRLAPIITSTGGGVVALDDLGRVVWAWPPGDEASGGTPFRARLSRDKQAVLYNESAASTSEPGRIWRVSLDGGTVETAQITGLHTDFVEYTHRGYAGLGSDIREVEGGRRILGDTIREVAPDGTERVVWSAWDSFEPDLDQTYPGVYPADPGVEDWTHINGISYDEAEGDYYVTITVTNSVARVDGNSGDLVWWFADNDGDFDNLDGRSRVMMPHSVQRIDGGLTIFSRGSPMDTEACSSAVDIALDETTMESREVWRHIAEPCLLVTFLGGAERLPGGNTLISWTTAGRLSEVTPDGKVAWQVSTRLGAAIGFSEQVPRLGP